MSLAGYAPSLLSALDILVTPRDLSAYILQSQPLLSRFLPFSFSFKRCKLIQIISHFSNSSHFSIRIPLTLLSQVHVILILKCVIIAL